MDEQHFWSEKYIPTTVEKKRAIAWLFFVGIVMMLTLQRELSVFERYYLALSLSLWTIGFVLFFFAILVSFVLPLLGYLFVLILLWWFVVWVLSIHYAWLWAYNSTFIIMKIFVALGEWLLSLFGEDVSSA